MMVRPTSIDGLYELQTTPLGDNRGRFTRIFCERELTSIRPGLHFTQINLSETRGMGALRGLHYQTPPAAEAKLIRCLRGRVFDVAVDLRADSATFLRWHALELAEDNDREILIPEGFAHGFQALTDEVQLLYMHTASWTPTCEAGLRYDDPRLAIAWPRMATTISERDLSHALIDAAFTGMQL